MADRGLPVGAQKPCGSQSLAKKAMFLPVAFSINRRSCKVSGRASRFDSSCRQAARTRSSSPTSIYGSGRPGGFIPARSVDFPNCSMLRRTSFESYFPMCPKEQSWMLSQAFARSVAVCRCSNLLIRAMSLDRCRRRKQSHGGRFGNSRDEVGAPTAAAIGWAFIAAAPQSLRPWTHPTTQ